MQGLSICFLKSPQAAKKTSLLQSRCLPTEAVRQASPQADGQGRRGLWHQGSVSEARVLPAVTVDISGPEFPPHNNAWSLALVGRARYLPARPLLSAGGSQAENTGRPWWMESWGHPQGSVVGRPDPYLLLSPPTEMGADVTPSSRLEAGRGGGSPRHPVPDHCWASFPSAIRAFRSLPDSSPRPHHCPL